MRLHLAPWATPLRGPAAARRSPGLAALLPAALALGLAVTPVWHSWGGTDTRPDLPAAADLMAGLGAGCSPADVWPAGVIPGSVVVERGGRVERLPFDTAWHLAESGQAWVVELCSAAL